MNGIFFKSNCFECFYGKYVFLLLRKYINVVYKFVYCNFYKRVLEDSVLIIFIFLFNVWIMLILMKDIYI